MTGALFGNLVGSSLLPLIGTGLGFRGFLDKSKKQLYTAITLMALSAGITKHLFGGMLR